VQPINIVEQQIVSVNRQVVPGAAYVAGTTVVGVNSGAVGACLPAGAAAVGGVYASAWNGTAGVWSSGNAAAALDAADGVIDGRYFGRQIVSNF
jgi:hypothetical protein